MRCIEIEKSYQKKVDKKGLTLTWDVLKYFCLMTIRCVKLININMRCIEIFDCINKTYAHYGLTLTWDVLKLKLW